MGIAIATNMTLSCGELVTWQRLGPLDDPQQLLLAQPVEAVEQEVGHFRLRVVIAGVHGLRLDVLQNVDDLLRELHLVDARDAGHGGQGLTVPGQGQVGLEHEGRGQTQRFQGSETLQFSACDTKIKGKKTGYVIYHLV